MMQVQFPEFTNPTTTVQGESDTLAFVCWDRTTLAYTYLYEDAYKQNTVYHFQKSLSNSKN